MDDCLWQHEASFFFVINQPTCSVYGLFFDRREAMWPLLLDMTREESKRVLRRLELEAYSSVISVFRAQGDLTKEKKKQLQELQNTLRHAWLWLSLTPSSLLIAVVLLNIVIILKINTWYWYLVLKLMHINALNESNPVKNLFKTLFTCKKKNIKLNPLFSKACVNYRKPLVKCPQHFSVTVYFEGEGMYWSSSYTECNKFGEDDHISSLLTIRSLWDSAI